MQTETENRNRNICLYRIICIYNSQALISKRRHTLTILLYHLTFLNE